MEDIALSGFGDILKAYRKRRKISQQELASRLDLHRNTIGGWERGDFLPESKTMVLELAKQLHLNENETRQLLQASLTAISPYWNVPYQRNPFFTGRDSVLQQLYSALTHERTAILNQSYALSGLGGIGKTQTAIEYAYRYANDYAAVFWISAETNESTISSFVATAEQLQLSEREEKDQQKLVKAVQQWLSTHKEWLLIFDNVEDALTLKTILPPVRQGAILITTRLHTLEGMAHILELAVFTQTEALQFLVSRANLADLAFPLDNLPGDLLTDATTLVKATDCLPLALDQAGAYIERTGCSLAQYLHLFQSHRGHLLAERSLAAAHPQSVVQTFLLSFEKVWQTNAMATNLLRLCVFLHPDAIPEELLIDSTTDPFLLNQAIAELLQFSLVKRSVKNKTLSLHRLVQAVLLDMMTVQERDQWMQRTLMKINAIFPDVNTATEEQVLKQAARILPHALLCLDSENTTEPLVFTSIGSKVARYLYVIGRYRDAESLFLRMQPIQEQILGSNHVDIARTLNGLGVIYWMQGRYDQAEPLYQRALSIHEQNHDYSKVGLVLNNLALVYWNLGRYDQAEPLYQRALSIHEQNHDDHTQIAFVLNNLAALFREQNKDKQAEPLYERALHIQEENLGSDHPLVAQTLDNLAIVYWNLGKHRQALLFNQRALHIVERVQGPDHPDTARSLNNMADLYRYQGKYEQAEPLYQRALQLWELALGTDHPLVTEPLSGLAELYQDQGNLHEALSLAERALNISEQALGNTHDKTLRRRAFYEQLLKKQEISD